MSADVVACELVLAGSVEVLVAWLETKLLVFRLYGHCFRGRPKVDLEDIVEKAPV